MMVRRMAGIVKILFDTHPTFRAGRAGQKRTHQQPVTLQPVDLLLKSIDKSLLIILWSTVQVRDALPFISFKSLCTTLQSDFFVGVCQVGTCCQPSNSTLRGCVQWRNATQRWRRTDQLEIFVDFKIKMCKMICGMVKNSRSNYNLFNLPFNNFKEIKWKKFFYRSLLFP